jgi:hypothetical protein
MMIGLLTLVNHLLNPVFILEKFQNISLEVLDAAPICPGVVVMVIHHCLLRCSHPDSILLAGLLASLFGVFIAVRLQGHCL